MNCPNCGKPLDPGAAFCGNCGQALTIPQAPPVPPAPQAPVVVAPQAPAPTPIPMPSPPSVPMASPIAQVWNNQQPSAVTPTFNQPVGVGVGVNGALPAYAVPVVGQHIDEHKATLSLVFGILALVALWFVILLGVAFGITGIVLATLSRRSTKKGLSTAGLIVSIIAVVLSIAAWAILYNHTVKLQHSANVPASSSSTTSSNSVATPCYSVNFGSGISIKNTSGSCDVDAYDGASFDNSNNVYRVIASAAPSATVDNLTTVAKPAIENDIKNNLPSFSIDSETAGTFSGSPAYIVNASNSQQQSVVEAAVLHKTSNGDNFYVLVHGQNTATTDLSSMESGWQWQ